MKRKIFAVVVLLLASGYVVSLCFRGMNLASDLYYIGGIFGLCVWFLVVVPLLYKLLTWRKHAKKPDSDSGPAVAGV